MAKESNYRSLEVWQKTRTITRDVYRLTGGFPRQEVFGMVQQMRRAALSILCNIAEGQGRWTRADYRHFLLMARGSALELEAQIVIAEDLEYLTQESAADLNNRITEIARMLNGIIRYLNRQ
jgi:four helix bundle protein